MGGGRERERKRERESSEIDRERQGGGGGDRDRDREGGSLENDVYEVTQLLQGAADKNEICMCFCRVLFDGVNLRQDDW